MLQPLVQPAVVIELPQHDVVAAQQVVFCLQHRTLWQRCCLQQLRASAVDATENKTAAAAKKLNARIISDSFKLNTGARPWEVPTLGVPLLLSNSFFQMNR